MDKPQKYRSLPVEITAMQWTRENTEAIREWMLPTYYVGGLGSEKIAKKVVAGKWSASLWVAKSNAWCDIAVGDWVVAESDGVGYYPVKESVFAERYQKVRPLRKRVAK